MASSLSLSMTDRVRNAIVASMSVWCTPYEGWLTRDVNDGKIHKDGVPRSPAFVATLTPLNAGEHDRTRGRFVFLQNACNSEDYSTTTTLDDIAQLHIADACRDPLHITI